MRRRYPGLRVQGLGVWGLGDTRALVPRIRGLGFGGLSGLAFRGISGFRGFVFRGFRVRGLGAKGLGITLSGGA